MGVAVTVRVEIANDPEGTIIDEVLSVAMGAGPGNPKTFLVRETVPENFSILVMLTLESWEVPRRTTRSMGLESMPKSGPVTVTKTEVELETAGLAVPFPLTPRR